EHAESGATKAIVLLGADPVGTWPGGERWRAVLGRCFFALQVTGFQGASSGWATTIVPSAAAIEQDGTYTNLEGRTQRLRAAVAPPPGVLDGVGLAVALAQRLGMESPVDAQRAFEEMAQQRPAFAGQSWQEIGEQAELPDERAARPSTPP